ncbi:MAG: hypothetical protein K8R23_18180 [Chthoniobacter sp.]|nr:hypothetical protein [Chthoniobacter sp.]
MPAEAHVTKTWKNQKLLVALVLLIFSLPFFYDGAVGYEKKNDRYREWKAFREEKDGKKEADWAAYAKAKGWDPEEWPKHVREHKLQNNLPEIPFPRGKIIEQYVCAGLAILFGSITLAYWAGQKGRVVKTDADAVYSPAGTRVPFSTITGVGKKKWEAKGLATVRYEIEGRKGEFELDDYKFDRDATVKILEEIEAHLIPDAPSEPEPSTPPDNTIS